MERAAFRVLAGIDFNGEAVEVFRRNFPAVAHVLQKDLTKFAPHELASLIGTDEVDVVVGGPPCQGFSTVRQRDGANHGPRMVEDQRRNLYQDFLRYVEYFLPKVFVMENVTGIRSAAGGRYFTNVQRDARAIGYRVHSQIEKAIDLGVPQKRQRQLIIGTRLDMPDFFHGDLKPAPRAKVKPTLGKAIEDLPPLRAGEGEKTTDYDMDRRRKYVAKYGRDYIFSVLEVAKTKKLTAHKARPHSERDLRDFARLREGEHCAEAMQRGVEFEFPYDRDSFKDRYTRQHRNEACSTIVAHLSKDGLMFIHPTQNRSLTPREAARVQSFPDWFEFPVARTHQFRVIGNAVPPLVAEAVGLAVCEYLAAVESRGSRKKAELHLLPSNPREAVEWLLPLIRAADGKKLRTVPPATFKRGWFSIGFLFHGLHPDSALEHGREIQYIEENVPEFCSDSRLLSPIYAQSGWPVVLEPVAREAWRRYESNELTDAEFYCGEAALAGLCCNEKSDSEATRTRY